MQVSVEELEGLERRMTVQVPAETIDKEVEGRLRSLSRKARIDGFRPGKVPFKVVKRMYGPQVRQEVIGDVLQSSLQNAMTEQALRPAGGPRIDSLNAEEGSSLEYSATFEVFPEFDPKPIDNEKIVQPVAEVTDADVDAMLQTLREQRALWESVERPAQLKDRVRISFEGTLDGADFPGNKGDDVPLVLGSGAMIEGFEQSLLSHSAGETVEFDLTFPADYAAAELAGKEVHFKVDIKTVEAPQLPEVDEAFAASFGVVDGGIDKLREALRENMARELRENIKNAIKKQVMDALLAVNDILLPHAMVAREIDAIAEQSNFKNPEGDENPEQTKSAIFREAAERRVALSLIVSRLVAANEISIDEGRVQQQLETIASSYEDKEAVIRWYRQNQKMMDSINMLVMEDQVVDWLLQRADVVEKQSSFDEVMKPQKTVGTA